MVIQCVMAKTAERYAGSSEKVPEKNKKKDSDFCLIFGKSPKSENVEKTRISADRQVQTETVNNDDSNNISEQHKILAEKDVVNTKQGKSSKLQSGNDNKKLQTDPEQDKTNDDQMLLQINGAITSIRKTVIEILQISNEEMNQLMSDQGITNVDLLNMDTLRQMVLKNSGKVDIVAALTDENLADTMKQLVQTVGQIKENLNLDLSEDQIKGLIEQLKDEGSITPEQLQTNMKDGNTVRQNNTDKINVNSTKHLDAEEAAVQRGTVKENMMETADDNVKYIINESADKENTIKPTAKEVRKDIISKLTDETSGDDVKVITKQSSKLTTAVKDGDNQAQTGNTGEDSKNLKQPDQFQRFVNNLVNTSQKIQSESDSSLIQSGQLKEIADQIIEQIKVIIKPDQTSMELQLNPENLGKVNLTIQSKDGVMSAQFIVHSDVSKEAIESQMHILRDTLEQQGVKVDAIEVSVASYSFEQSDQTGSGKSSYQKKSSSGRKISIEEALNMSDSSDQENSIPDNSRQSGSLVDFTA